jgi:hypothetical protein
MFGNLRRLHARDTRKGGGITCDARRVALGLGALFALTLSPRMAGAVEAGKSHYPIGVNTANPAAVAPPVGDTTLLDYNEWYTANISVNGQGISSIPGYQLNTYVIAPRILHTWADYNGFLIGTQIVPVFAYTDLHIEGKHVERAGFGDLNFAPYVQYNRGDWYYAFYGNVWAPTGRYSKADPASQGLNFWTFAPQFTVTWVPNHGKYEVSLDTVTEFNTENAAQHYQSGDLFTLDGDIGVRPFDHLPNLQLALIGYIHTQWTDDSQFGKAVNNGDRAQVYAIGPQAKYSWGNNGVVLKWEHELGVANAPSGERVWLQYKTQFH